MSRIVEYFVSGSPARLKKLLLTLPDGMEVIAVGGGLVLRQPVGPAHDLDATIGRIETLALAQGLTYEGHGQSLEDEAEDGNQRGPLDIQRRTFTDRTRIPAGHAFALPLEDGRFGHAVYLGSDRQGYLLLDISSLVTELPASAQFVREAGRRYRQPVLVWHTDFAAILLESAAPLAQLPCEVFFRCGCGWPDPDQFVWLERRFGIEDSATSDRWIDLLLAMAEMGEPLPGIESHSLVMARVARSGALKLISDHAPMVLQDRARAPMPWQPATIAEVAKALGGGADLISAYDIVT